jgi:hypothetical protein
MKTASFVLATLVALTAAQTKEEIEARSAEILEEFRTNRGHWQRLNSINMVDHMADHLGKNGMAVAAFFIDETVYHDAEAGPETQALDPLFVEYEKMAKDQSWLNDCCPGVGHKTWSFGYGHSKKVAMEAGCDDIGTWEWKYACVVIFKSSPDGTALSTTHTVSFGHDHSKGIMPTPADIRKFIYTEAGKKISNPGAISEL